MTPSPNVGSAATALSVARTYLNDVSGVTWPDALLLPLLQTAFSEMNAKLVANGTAIVRNQESIVTIPAIDPSVTPPIPFPSLPSNLVFPISLQEKQSGDDIEFFVTMFEVDFVPMVDPVEELRYWAWQGQQIMLVGATVAVDVLLRYRGSLTIPQTLNDSLGFIFAENYLGPRIASLAAMSSGNESYQSFQAQADSNLDTVLRLNIVGSQGVGKRRGSYRRGGLRKIF